MALHLGIDFGGTKTEIIGLDNQTGKELYRHRIKTDRSEYDKIISSFRQLVADAESALGKAAAVGIGIPGSLHPQTQRVRNSNSVITNGRLMAKDCSLALGREVRVENDANCFAISEAVDGAGKGSATVFGVIIGTGCGGGLAINGKIHRGRNGLAGEWGHNPLPFPCLASNNPQSYDDYFDAVGREEVAEIYREKPSIPLYKPSFQESEFPGRQCYCGKRGCLETWLSGTGFSHDHQHSFGEINSAEMIIATMRQGNANAILSFDRYCERLAKSLAQVVNIFDPDIIVLGGGMSNATELYEEVPRRWQKYIFSEDCDTPLVSAMHGDSSGVRGAARLW